jgi:Concanavalin A-like lectin/glucanases superfamily
LRKYFNKKATPISLMLLFVLLAPGRSPGDVVCDAVNDELTTGVAQSTFMSASTGTFMLWFKPTGAADGSGATCNFAQFVMGFSSSANYGALMRNANYGGTDSLCAFNFSGGYNSIGTAYTVNAWTHLAWVHGGGNISLYKDGTLVSSTASGNTDDVTQNLQVCHPAGEAVYKARGVVAAPQVFPTALSAGEITSLGKAKLHRVARSAPSGVWDFSRCGDGASCAGMGFTDRSGNNRTMSVVDGTGVGSDYLSYPWGVE